MRFKDLRQYLRLRRLVRNAWATVRRCRSRTARAAHTVRLRDGATLLLRPEMMDDLIFREVFLHDEYRMAEFGPGELGCVLDLGGNIGVFTARVAPLATRVIVYEPIHENFARLQEHVGGLAHVTICRQAVTARTGTVRLYHPDDPANPGRCSGFALAPDSTYEDVPSVTLNDVFSEHGIEECDMLKIDVEGHEYEILHSASDETLARIRRIHGEYHDRAREDPRTRIANLRRYLESKGFAVELVPVEQRENFGMFFAARAGGAG